MPKQTDARNRIGITDLDGIKPKPRGKRLLALAVAACLPGAVSAETAGTVKFSNGTAMVIYPDGNRVSLSPGMTVSQSDTIRTGESGMAQIRFTDGAYVSIQKNTIFKIEEYSYEKQADEAAEAPSSNRGFFSLLQGGFRTITGFLGVKNYRVRTPVATIGIRGTAYFAEYGRSLNFNVGDGAIEICNPGGCQFFRENEFGDIKEGSRLIQRLRDLGLDVVLSEVQDKTLASVEGSDEFVFSVGEEVNDAGEPAILFGNLNFDCNSANCTAAFGWLDSGPTVSAIVNTSLTGQFNSQSALTSHDGGNDEAPGADAVLTGTAEFAGSNSSMTWGRWTGGVSQAGYPAVHYVVGIPTPNINSMTGAYDFAVAGFTTPTSTGSLGGFNGITGSLTADFDSSLVNVNMTVDYANADYTLATGTPLSVNSDATFGGSITATGGIEPVSGPSSCDLGACSASIAGFFAGANADHAGLSYALDDPADGELTGAVVFDQSGPGSPIIVVLP